jgi:DNA topoisomerase-1
VLDEIDRPDVAPVAPRSLETVRTAALVHVNDTEPGIRRRRSGKGFAYISAEGKPVRDPDELARIRALAIPPAWTGVWIAGDPDGHIQATGRDLRGRKQYRYHQRWSVCRDEVKFSSLVTFAEALPSLRETVLGDLSRRGLPREKVIASIVWLLDNTMIRVGNVAYARDNKSFGLTTLRDRHVEIAGGTLRFNFKGKSGKEWRIRLVDRRMARILRGIQDLPGQQLFQYVGEDGQRHAVRSQDVNQYIREACGPTFSSKHFRTWGGTISATSIFAETPLPETKPVRARAMNAVVDQVAARLGNTRTVCRKCYIHPLVMERWHEGTLGAELRAARRSLRKPVAGLDEEEALVWRWLARA